MTLLPRKKPIQACLPERRRQALAWGLAGLGGLAGCTVFADQDHAGAQAPQAAALRRSPRLAWVLSSGGPRGFVHVGVLKALHELGLRPDLVVGASVGALVGSLYAAGLAPSAIETLALDLHPLGMAQWAVGAAERFSGAPLAALVYRHAPVHQLQDMPIAMACVALRRADRQVVAFTAGDAGIAVQASAAIEGRFAPVRIGAQQYVDADAVMPLPVRVARQLGATRVLAVDASAHVERAPEAAQRYRPSDLKKRALVLADAAHAELVLQPDFGYWVSLTREFRQHAIERGYRETMAQASALGALHAA